MLKYYSVLIMGLMIITNYFFIFAQEKNNTYKLQPENYLKTPDKGDLKYFIVTDYDIDENGNLLIFDYGKKRILKYSNEGKFIKSFGRKGEGPGEFPDGIFVTLSKYGNIFSSQFTKGKLEILDINGKYLKDVNYYEKRYFIGQIQAINNDYMFAKLADIFSKKDIQTNTKYYYAVINVNNLSKINVGDIVENEIGDFSEYYTNIAIYKKNEFYLGRKSKDEYKVYRYDIKGNLNRTISKNIEPVEMKGERKKKFDEVNEKKKMIYKTKFGVDIKEDNAPYYSYIDCIATDSYSNLWVFTSEKTNYNIISVDFYDNYGNYKKTFYIDNYELAIQNFSKIKIFKDYLYAHVIANDGYEHIYRYKLPKEIWD
jgi:hypothetical protein